MQQRSGSIIGLGSIVLVFSLCGCSAISSTAVQSPRSPRAASSPSPFVDNRMLTSEEAYSKCWAAYAATQKPQPSREDVAAEQWYSTDQGLHVTMTTKTSKVLDCVVAPGGADGTGILLSYRATD